MRTPCSIASRNSSPNGPPRRRAPSKSRSARALASGVLIPTLDDADLYAEQPSDRNPARGDGSRCPRRGDYLRRRSDGNRGRQARAAPGGEGAAAYRMRRRNPRASESRGSGHYGARRERGLRAAPPQGGPASGINGRGRSETRRGRGASRRIDSDRPLVPPSSTPAAAEQGNGVTIRKGGTEQSGASGAHRRNAPSRSKGLNLGGIRSRCPRCRPRGRLPTSNEDRC